MQFHLHVKVADLDAAQAQVVALGASPFPDQPSPDTCRVMADPVGHVFCLVPPTLTSADQWKPARASAARTVRTAHGEPDNGAQPTTVSTSQLAFTPPIPVSEP
jgi:hypothetical protein